VKDLLKELTKTGGHYTSFQQVSGIIHSSTVDFNFACAPIDRSAFFPPACPYPLKCLHPKCCLYLTGFPQFVDKHFYPIFAVHLK
jgi:hypothetical protein